MASPYRDTSRESRLHREGDRNNSYNYQRDRDEQYYYHNQEPVHPERREPRESRGHRHGHRTSNPVNGIDAERRHGSHHGHGRPSSSQQHRRGDQPVDQDARDPRRARHRAEEDDAWSNSANQGSYNGYDNRNNPRPHVVVSPEPRRSVQPLYDPRVRNRPAEARDALDQFDQIFRRGGSGSHGGQDEAAEEAPQRRGGGSGSHGRQAEARDTRHQFDKNFRRGGSGSGSHRRQH